MRKKLTLFAAVLVAIAFGFGIKALGWTSTAPADITDGVYYIYNVGHEQFLHQGNSWGTRASMFPEAYACHVVKNDDGTIKIQPLNGTKWLGDNAYMDNGTAVNFTATAVEGGYTLTNGSLALAWDGNEVNYVEGATGANATWQILTADELKSGFASVTADKPVDATFMIKGPRILRENSDWQNSWTCDPNPAIRVEGDGQGASAEVWNNSVSITQEVDLVKGGYKLTVTGFYRFGGKAEAIAAHNDGTEQLHAYIMAGEAKTPLMSICDGKGITDLNAIVNDQASAGKALMNGMYNNTLYFRVENDGPVTIGVKKDELVYADWTVVGNFTLTYYGANATVEDMIPKVADVTDLKVACEAARAKLGFQIGQCAPYNNAASMQTLADAEAMTAEEQYDQAAVDAMTAAVNSLEWTANEHRMDAVYNGDFLLSENDGAPAGWRQSNNTLGGAFHSRAFVLSEGMTNYEQLAAFQPDNSTRGALFIRFDNTNADRGSLYIYGQGTNAVEAATPYCMPLKAGVAYNFNADIAGWGGTGRNIKMYIVDAAGETVGQQTIAPASDCSKVGGTTDHFAFEFTPTVDGNCVIYIQCPGGEAGKNALVSNFSISVPKNAQTITWEQDFTNVMETQTIELKATASSEFPVAYEFADAEAAAGIATIDGNKLTFTAVGTVTVNAIQAGNDDYLPAEPVSKTITATEYIPLAEVPADGYYWIKNVETEQYMIHNGYWGTLTTLGEYGVPVKVATVDGNTTLAFADYNLSEANWFLFKDGANNADGVQNVYSDNKQDGDNNSHIWTIVPATTTSLYIKNAHNGAYMFANTDNDVAYVQTSVAEVENCHWQFVPAAEVAEFVAAKRDAQAAAMAEMAGVEAATEAALVDAFAYSIDVTDQVTLPASRGEAYQPGGGDGGLLDNSKEVMNFSIVAPKAGLYKIVVPAMWRNGTNSVTETLANADIDIANTTIYTDNFTGVVLGQSAGASATDYDYANKASDNNAPVALTIKGETVYVPNSEDGFQAWAENGQFGNVVYAYAAEDGATITIKAKASSGRNWHGQWFVHNAPLTKVYYLTQEEPVVPKKDQAIEWNQEFNGIELNQPVALTATATSGLEVAYALEAENENAALSGSEITFTANCTVVVVASQEGNDEWNAAEPVKKTIVVETDGISSISATDADALFFSLQGVQIKTPQPGQVYIVVKADRAFKALVK